MTSILLAFFVLLKLGRHYVCKTHWWYNKRIFQSHKRFPPLITWLLFMNVHIVLIPTFCVWKISYSFEKIISSIFTMLKTILNDIHISSVLLLLRDYFALITLPEIYMSLGYLKKEVDCWTIYYTIFEVSLWRIFTKKENM